MLQTRTGHTDWESSDTYYIYICIFHIHKLPSMLHAYSIPDLSIWCLAVKPQLGPTNTKEYLWIWDDFGQLWYRTMPVLGPVCQCLSSSKTAGLQGIQCHFKRNETPSVRRSVGTGKWDAVQLASFEGKFLRLCAIVEKIEMSSQEQQEIT